MYLDNKYINKNKYNKRKIKVFKTNESKINKLADLCPDFRDLKPLQMYKNLDILDPYSLDFNYEPIKTALIKRNDDNAFENSSLN